MTFVFPVLLGGLVLAGIPILLHLIMRQKPKTLSFPAFRFLVQRHRTNLRKLQLRHLVLLAMRILLIALVCLALGRPRLFNQGLNLSSERPVAAVLVFDTSLSMEYRTSDNISRLEEAKKRGQEFLNELPEGSRVVILDTAGAVASGRGDWLSSMSQARLRIKDLKLRPASVSALQTLAYAYRILGELARSREDEMRRTLPRFVVVFSDRTRACWDLSKLAAAQTAADQVPSSLEGLQQSRDSIAPMIGLLKELRAKLPPPPGRDYPEQALIDYLEQLGPLLPSLTKADFPPDDKLGALTENIQRRGRDLLDLLQAKDEKDNEKAPEGFRAKLIQNLQGVLRDLSGAQGLFVDVGIDQPVDLAITDLEFPVQANGQPRLVFGPKEKFILRAIVAAVGQELKTTLTCKIGQKTYQQPAEIKAGERQTISFEIDCLELNLLPGPHQVEVRCDPPDLLAFNNRRFATFAIREPPRVLVLSEDAGNAKYFSWALKSHDYAVDELSLDKLPEVDPRLYHAVYLFEVKAPGQRVWSFLSDLVRQGVGLGIIPGGEEMDLRAYNQEAAQGVMPGKLVRKVVQGEDGGKKPGAIWDLANDNNDTMYQHPFMRPFRNWHFDEINFIQRPSEAFRFWEVELHPAGLAIVNYKDDKKHPALVERLLSQERGKPGRILLFTIPLDNRSPRWSNYLETALNAMYVSLVGLATNYLAGATEAPRLNFTTGQNEPVVALPPSARFPAYTLNGPDRLDNIPAPDGQNELKLRQVETPGNYVLEGLAGAAEAAKPVAAFSVNVSSEESDLTRVPFREVESLFGPGAVLPADRKANIRELLTNHWNEPVDLFPLLMVILLVILAVENLLANKFYRRDNTRSEN